MYYCERKGQPRPPRPPYWFPVLQLVLLLARMLWEMVRDS